MTTDESILDHPKEDLDPSVWRRGEDGTYSLRETAMSKIYVLVKWAVDVLGVSDYGVNIIGSITSNSYKEDSDIDVHFNSKEIPEEKGEVVNDMLKREFRKYKEENEDSVFIGRHPMEVYFQTNPYQDMMSVGCYDVINERWLVGPELKDTGFDPYSEYYSQDMTYVQDIIDDIRNVILEAYESALVIRNSKDDKFRRFEIGHLKNIIGRGAQIFTQAREFRKVSSSPRNEMQAKTIMASRKWKVADSAFKLLDRFGYLGILHEMTSCHTKSRDGEMGDEEVVERIVGSIRDNLSGNGNLNEDETYCFSEVANESVGDIARYAMLLGALALPFSAVSKDDGIRNEIPKRQMEVMGRQIGGMSYLNNVNMVAWTLWTEARGERARFGIRSLNAVASVIVNRADNDPQNLVRVISKPRAFSWWNGYDGGWDDYTFIPHSPSKSELKNPKNVKIWNDCNEIAAKVVDGKFRSTIGNMNSYLNKDTADSSAVRSWGRKCTLRIGNHWFGYLPENDGSRKYASKKNGVKGNSVDNAHPRKYVVKKGDTLGSIARRFNTTVEKIVSGNPDMKNPDRISVGQSISV